LYDYFYVAVEESGLSVVQILSETVYYYDNGLWGGRGGRRRFIGF
jgi:hypothetical protein